MKEFKLPKIFNWELAHEKIKEQGSSAAGLKPGDEYLGGIVFNVYTDENGEQHGHVVSKVEATHILSNNSLTNNFATSNWDGEKNTDEIPGGANSPAKVYVESQGAGWYIPSISEFQLIRNNIYFVNKKLHSLGATQIGINVNVNDTPAYWTSTFVKNDPATSSSNAYFFRFTLDTSASTTCTNAYRVRAIKQF